jgi:amino acid transporter
MFEHSDSEEGQSLDINPADAASVEKLQVVQAIGEPVAAPSLHERVKSLLIGKSRDLRDKEIFQHVSLAAFLAWVGLGADGLSSSCYGPSEAFHHLGSHTYLAIFLSLATIVTVVVISLCYSHIIEEFPSGGGGYLVASKLLGRRAGVLSGSALLVDYVLTITVSIAAAGDALFGLIGATDSSFKFYAESAAILGLIVLNLRGIKESVTVLVPIFLLFIFTHLLLIGGSILLHLGAAGEVTQAVTNEVSKSVQDPNFGWMGMIMLLLFAYSQGAGTYTGIEAVSNSMPVMREPRVATAKRTMIYMALSLALTAGGLMVAYLLLNIQHVEGKTLNQVLTESLVSELGLGGSTWGSAFVWLTMITEGALLIVAAQAGFIDGPRVLANMAQDSYAPHWFANLSERLTTHNGIILMGTAAFGALAYSHGNVTTLVTMYSINVFLTFSLSMLGMIRLWWSRRGKDPLWQKRLALFTTGGVMCLCILGVTIVSKFEQGAYMTLLVTASCVGLSLLTHRYYVNVVLRLRKLDDSLGEPASAQTPCNEEPKRDDPIAVVLVGGYSGLGIHTMLNAFRFAPGYFKGLAFVSTAVVDSGNFKGANAVESLEQHVRQTLERYVDLANRLGMPATSFLAVDTDAVDGLERLCVEVAKRYPRSMFFAGQLLFQRDAWYQHVLHNQTAFALQRRLQWDGIPMVILPTRVR